MFVKRSKLLVIPYWISTITIFVHSKPIELDSVPYTASDIEEINSTIPILSQSVESSPDGSFSYSFETANQIKQQANGYRKTISVPQARGLDDNGNSNGFDSVDVIVQVGSYEYIAPNGKIISVSWIADENGFQPTIGKNAIPEHELELFSNIQNQQRSARERQQTIEEEAQTVEQQRHQRSSITKAFLPTLLQ